MIAAGAGVGGKMRAGAMWRLPRGAREKAMGKNISIIGAGFGALTGAYARQMLFPPKRRRTNKYRPARA